jgi:uncharacterized YigZ family protein
MKESYITISSPARANLREKGSKFFSFAFPVQQESDIRTQVELLKKEYFDATHHCYAWMLGPEGIKFRANDDGEPSHSAGDPILGQIRSRGLTNILIVVVRYYGGTNLGVSGLIKAYKGAAALALDQAALMEVEVMEQIKITFGYDELPVVMRLLKQESIQLLLLRTLRMCISCLSQV